MFLITICLGSQPWWVKDAGWERQGVVMIGNANPGNLEAFKLSLKNSENLQRFPDRVGCWPRIRTQATRAAQNRDYYSLYNRPMLKVHFVDPALYLFLHDWVTYLFKYMSESVILSSSSPGPFLSIQSVPAQTQTTWTNSYILSFSLCQLYHHHYHELS